MASGDLVSDCVPANILAHGQGRLSIGWRIKYTAIVLRDLIVSVP